MLLVSVALAAPPVAEGDLVFHRSRSEQARFLEAATHSPYTHVGVVTFREGAPWVLEAVEPVKLTPLREWAERAADGKIAIRRLAHPEEVTAEERSRMEELGRSWLGRHYDLAFGWSDEELYCSELVHKLFLVAGVELGTPHLLGDFDLSDPKVRAAAEKRWGRIPVEELVVAPVDVYADPDLVDVCEATVASCLGS
jgi:hypothetical protein